MKKLGEGAISMAYINEESQRVTLVPKRLDYYRRIQALKTNLDLVCGRIKSVLIPFKSELIEPCSEFPHGAISYSFVPGQMLNECVDRLSVEQKIKVGKKLAEFINELHSLKGEFSKQQEIKDHIKKLARGIAIISPHLTAIENQKIEEIAQRFPAFLESRDFSLTHGDLHIGNLVVDANYELVGVIDFANMGYYVPEMEFVSIMHVFLDEKILDTALKHYNKSISMKDVLYLRIVHRIRYFKHSLYWEEAMKLDEIKKFKALLAEFS